MNMNVNVNDKIVASPISFASFAYCPGYRWCVNSVQISSFGGNMSAKLISEKLGEAQKMQRVLSGVWLAVHVLALVYT